MATAKKTRRSRIKKGDQVVVIAGRDNGKRGRVLEVKPAEGKVKVEGIQMIKRHQKANPASGRGGGIIDREAYINISNVQLIDPQSGKPTRVRYQINDDGTKTRVAVRSGHTLDKD
ncbi:MAG TPA: 50S ribosomal protein L24 [Pyrinomonadaceae bacterium]|jgi:large subunit ribosomal protein L24|nr:50S ribosomal protein L24 [Pyrinomonadaceae bacterium]